MSESSVSPAVEDSRPLLTSKQKLLEHVEAALAEISQLASPPANYAAACDVAEGALSGVREFLKQSSEKLQEAIDLLFECRDVLATVDSAGDSELYPRVWKWCRENRDVAVTSDETSARLGAEPGPCEPHCATCKCYAVETTVGPHDPPDGCLDCLRVERGSAQGATAMRWAQQQRLLHIARMLRTMGTVNRCHLVAMFGISFPQASTDLKRFMELNPGAMAYNPSLKCYERQPESQVSESTPKP